MERDWDPGPGFKVVRVREVREVRVKVFASQCEDDSLNELAVWLFSWLAGQMIMKTCLAYLRV